MENALYILNPKSNGGRSQKVWNNLVSKYDFLPEEPVDLQKTENISRVIKQKSPDLVVIAGGDGTINSVAKAVLAMEAKSDLAVLPLGFGNALAYNLGITDIQKAVSIIKSRTRKVVIDVIKTDVQKHPIGLFAVSFGFDALAVYTKDSKYLKSIDPYSYLFSTAYSVFKHKPKPLKIKMNDDLEMRTVAASLLVANGPVIGKNLLVSEGAKFDDGLLDCTLFLSKASYVKNLRYKGHKHPLSSKMQGKVCFKTKKLTISGETYMQIDGDAVKVKKPVELSVSKGSLTFLCA